MPVPQPDHILRLYLNKRVRSGPHATPANQLATLLSPSGQYDAGSEVTRRITQIGAFLIVYPERGYYGRTGTQQSKSQANLPFVFVTDTATYELSAHIRRHDKPPHFTMVNGWLIL